MQARSYVASNGLDTNDGKLATPCRSIGAALAQTNPGGEIIVLDSAGYGAAVINKSGVGHRAARDLRRHHGDGRRGHRRHELAS